MISYTVYECEETGRTFKDEEKCKRHERKARKERLAEEERKALKEEAESSFRKNLKSIDEDYLKKYITDWLYEYNKVVIEISCIDLSFSEVISNSHYAPIGKDTNWGRRPDLPRGYPGWSGRIEGKIIEGAVVPNYYGKGRHKELNDFSDYTDSSFSECSVSRMIGFHTGGGGQGGNGGFGYYCTMFADDFPYLKKLALKDVLRQGK